MWHWMVDAILALGLFLLGFLAGGTVAWYKGWDEGFREGYNQDIEENTPQRKPVTPVAPERTRPDAGQSHFGARRAS